MPPAQRAFSLTDEGYAGLKRSAAACTLTDLSLMIPFVVTVMVFNIVLRTFTGEPLHTNQLWGLFAAGGIGLAVVFVAARNDYRKTYVAAYAESEQVRLSLAEHLRRLPLSFFNRRTVSDIGEHVMGDVTSQESLLSSTLPQLVAGCVSAALVCILLAFFEWRLALCVFVTIPLAFGVVLLSRKRERRLFEQQNAARIEALSRIRDYLEGIKDIRAYRMVGESSLGLRDALSDLKRIAMRVELSVDVCVSAANTVLRAGVGLTVFAGALLITNGQIDLITLLMFLLIVSRIYGPMTQLVSQLPNLLSLSTRAARIRSIMDEPETPGGPPAEVRSHTLEFDDVSFGYGTIPVLRNVTFTAEEGSVTALVGPSGAGKSTVAQLAARFWDPWSGSVRAGGQDIGTFSEDSWLAHVSPVFQEVLLFDDTVSNNIRIGQQQATEEEVRAAAEAAHCLEFIERLPHGFDTMLGENGATLSGGERQRISIARALLKDAPIVLLDEATSSLDPENEGLVQEALGGLTRGKTVIVIAHRLRTIERADSIVVLEEGRVAGQGTHTELMRSCDLYARLWNLQERSMQWSLGGKRRDSDATSEQPVADALGKEGVD